MIDSQEAEEEEMTDTAPAGEAGTIDTEAAEEAEMTDTEAKAEAEEAAHTATIRETPESVIPTETVIEAPGDLTSIKLRDTRICPSSRLRQTCFT